MTDFRPSQLTRQVLLGAADMQIGQAGRLVLHGADGAVTVAASWRLILRSTVTATSTVHVSQADRLTLLAIAAPVSIASVWRLVLRSTAELVEAVNLRRRQLILPNVGPRTA